MISRQRTGQAPCSLFAIAAMVILLSGCVVAKNNMGMDAAVDSMQGKKAETEQRLATAAMDAIAAGKTDEAFVLYEKLYKRSAKDATVSLNYAQLLRKTGRVDEALAVLKPFAAQKGSLTAGQPPLAMMKTEYAAALIARGDFAAAQKLLDTVLMNADAAAFHPDASHLAGIALDAQGNHKAAEKLFRQALDGWQGDPTSVMNNLGLNLASQGMFDESLTTLRRAQIMAPDKAEIAQNIAIVNDLRRAVVPSAPMGIAPAKAK